MSILAVLLVLVGLAQTGFGHAVLTSVGLAGSSQPFTELYFPHPRRLQAQTDRAVSLQAVAFVIRNEEHVPRVYKWTIGTAQVPVLTAGQTVLGDRQQATIIRWIRTVCRGRRVQIRVTIAAPQETIAYWLACPSAPIPRPEPRPAERAGRRPQRR